MINEIFLYSTFSLTIFMGLLNSFKIIYSISYIKRQYKFLTNRGPSHRPCIFILMPVLRESKVIENSLENLSELNYPKEKVRIVVITTEREYEAVLPGLNTIELAKTKTESLNKKLGRELFLNIHYPHRIGIKSDQLNYALKILSEKFPDDFKDDTYIGTYDADSLIQQNILELLATDGSINGWADAYQQPTLYTKNHPKENVLAGSFSLLQTAFAFYHENYNFITQSNIIRRKKSPFFMKKMRYCIGHGLFVKWSTLKEVGLFPTPIEDTRLGHIFSYLDKEIRLLPSFDVVETTPNATSRIKQASVWFIGESYFWKDKQIANKVQPIPFLQSFWIGTYKFYRNSVWILRGELFLALFIFSLYKAGLVAILLPLIYLVLPVLIMIILLNRKIRVGRVKILMSLLLSPIEFLFMSLGPLLGFIKIFIFRSQNKKFLFPKTERT